LTAGRQRGVRRAASANEALLRALGANSALLPAFVHASLMLGRLRFSDGRLVRGLTATAVGLSLIPALLVAGGVALALGSPGAGAWRLLGVDLVLAVLTTLLLPIVRRLGSGDGDGRATRIRRGLLVHRGHAA
jgi:hypothetical protein